VEEVSLSNIYGYRIKLKEDMIWITGKITEGNKVTRHVKLDQTTC